MRPARATFRGILFGSSEYFTSCNRSFRLREFGENGPAPRSETPSGVERSSHGGSSQVNRTDEKFVPPHNHGRSWRVSPIWVSFFWFQGWFWETEPWNDGRNGKSHMARVVATHIFFYVYPENWEKWSNLTSIFFRWVEITNQVRFKVEWSLDESIRLRQRKVYWWMTKWNFKDSNMVEPKWPLFLKVNPTKQGLFQPKQGSFGF